MGVAGGDPTSVGSLSATRPQSQDLYDSDKMYVYCWGRKIPKLEISAKRKVNLYNIQTATAKGEEWNELIRTQVPPEHQPKPLLGNLNDEDSQYIFGGSEPVHVFSNACRARIKAHVKKVRKANPPPVATTRRNPGKAPISELTNTEPTFDENSLLFDDTIPKGQYVKAFNFINHYAEQAPRGRDNKGHSLMQIKLGGQVEGLVNPDMSKQHAATDYAYSSPHADLYMRKGPRWANVGDISNHTGIARVPTNETKLGRYATYIFNS